MATETYTQEEFEQKKKYYRGMLFVKEDSNGSKYYESTCECDRCLGKKIVYKGVHNGVLVPHTPDNGVCWKCNGSGIIPVIIKIITSEYNAKLKAQRLKKAQKEAAEREKRAAELRQSTYDVNIKSGYKKIDFTVEEWVGLKLDKYLFYRIAVETKRAYLIHLLDDLYKDDLSAVERWIPIKAFHKGGNK